jgi:translation initiation factor IF-2
LKLSAFPVCPWPVTSWPPWRRKKDAKQVSEHRLQKQRAKSLAATSRLSLEKLYEQLAEGEVKDLNIIVKADVQGSIEALSEALKKLSTDEVKVHIVHSAVGSILESDVSLAAVTNAIIIGFHVRPAPKVTVMADEEHVDIRYYDVIYNAIKDVQDAMVGLMAPRFEKDLWDRPKSGRCLRFPDSAPSRVPW